MAKFKGNKPDIGGVETRITTEACALPEFLELVVDTQFWESDPEISKFMAVIQALQSIVYAQCEATVYDIRRQWYIKLSQDLTRFARILAQSRYHLNFEEFRRILVSTWLAYSDWGTLAGLTKVVGAYTGQPPFFTRVEQHQDYWLLGTSQLGAGNDPHPEEEKIEFRSSPKSMVPSYYNEIAGIVVEVLGMGQLLALREAEFLRTLDNVADIAPLNLDLYEPEEPVGTITIKDRFHDFPLSSTVNAEFDKHFGGFVITNPDNRAEVKTIPVSTASLSASLVTVSIYDFIYSDAVTRRTLFREGDVLDDTDPSYTVFTEMRNFDIIPLSKEFIQFKVDVTPVYTTPDIFNYAFLGVGIKKPAKRAIIDPQCYEYNFIQIITQGYMSNCIFDLSFSKMSAGYFNGSTTMLWYP